MIDMERNTLEQATEALLNQVVEIDDVEEVDLWHAGTRPRWISLHFRGLRWMDMP